MEGPIRKMPVSHDTPVGYSLPIGDASIPLNPLVGSSIHLEYLGRILCIHCGRQTNKSFNRGYCYPCFARLARCDICIVKPELCHFHKGTCREPEWGEAHCMIAHTVYLANTSGLKVGISRGNRPVTRWIDQGATRAMAIRSVESRFDAGRAEVALKRFVADKTDWRKMLRGEPPEVDLAAERDRLLSRYGEKVPDRDLPGCPVDEARPESFHYPVRAYPSKITAHNFDKKPVLEGTLMGIKGQYLIFDGCVVNIRKYAGYCLRFSNAARGIHN